MRQIFQMILPIIGKKGVAKYVSLGILSGLLSFLFINLITQLVKLIVANNYKSISIEYAVTFSVVILFIVLVRRTLTSGIIRLSQTLYWTLRREILSLVIKANYQQLSSRKSKIYAIMINDINLLTQASMTIIDFSTFSIMGVACLIYLATISWVLFILTLATAILGISVHHFKSQQNVRKFKVARELENDFIEHFNSIMNGFKEIYMEPIKGKMIYNNKINDIGNKAYKNNTDAYIGYLNIQITGQVLFYILIASVLLVFSLLLNIKTEDTVNFIFILLYLLSSIEAVVVLLPNLSRAKIGTNNLIALKKELEDDKLNNEIDEKHIFKTNFNQIAVKNLEFHYGDNIQTFSIGPINLTIEKAEVVFIYGGNGSGKTTFVHSVLGLCKPSSGEISLNGTIVNDDNYQNYRSLFSVVFSDFYLFNELLMDTFDRKKWDYYLELFEIEDKVKLDGKSFSTVDLSTGQRKRLALIAALMEDKPILVLDEWAADQDPYFRKRFYTEIIPLLKQDGVTIIAITHDDKYYHCADKIYKMDDGKLIEENIEAMNYLA